MTGWKSTLDRKFIFTEMLHGDKFFGDDRAMRTGFAKLDQFKVMLVAHMKGRNLKERSACYFGCAHPEGYRKALLKMKFAEKFGLPVVTLINTPGAYPGVGAEERGQAEAIAFNLREMAKLTVPILVTVTGTVEFNQVNSPPLSSVGSGAPATMTFRVDPDVFVDSPNFPTRGYPIDPASFSLLLGAADLGVATAEGLESRTRVTTQLDLLIRNPHTVGRTEPVAAHEAVVATVALVDDHAVADRKPRTRCHLYDGAHPFVAEMLLVLVPLEGVVAVDLVFDADRRDRDSDQNVASRDRGKRLVDQSDLSRARDRQHGVGPAHAAPPR